MYFADRHCVKCEHNYEAFIPYAFSIYYNFNIILDRRLIYIIIDIQWFSTCDFVLFDCIILFIHYILYYDYFTMYIYKLHAHVFNH